MCPQNSSSAGGLRKGRIVLCRETPIAAPEPPGSGQRARVPVVLTSPWRAFQKTGHRPANHFQNSIMITYSDGVLSYARRAQVLSVLSTPLRKAA